MPKTTLAPLEIDALRKFERECCTVKWRRELWKDTSPKGPNSDLVAGLKALRQCFDLFRRQELSLQSFANPIGGDYRLMKGEVGARVDRIATLRFLRLGLTRMICGETEHSDGDRETWRDSPDLCRERNRIAARIWRFWFGTSTDSTALWYEKGSNQSESEDVPLHEPWFFSRAFAGYMGAYRYLELPSFYRQAIEYSDVDGFRAHIVSVSGFDKFRGGDSLAEIQAALIECASAGVRVWFVTPPPGKSRQTPAFRSGKEIQLWQRGLAPSVREQVCVKRIGSQKWASLHPGTVRFGGEYMSSTWRYTAIVTEGNELSAELVGIRPALGDRLLHRAFSPTRVERTKFAEWAAAFLFNPSTKA